ncbi:MAG: KpsF/GutQ family sugar-phosphate isomerase [Bacteroidota bacterium]
MANHKEILSIARETLLTEGQAVLNLAGSLDDSFADLVERIHSSKGRLILSGVGKSAHIAQKICATLNSIGTPSVFLHAADALHGDLGILGDQDLVLFISKSGNTPEIKVLVPQIRILGNSILAIVSDKDSYLESQAEISVHLPFPAEACPNNLIPTTSTTLQLALGDALAICLLKLKGFSASDFARLHPGGALGKRLYLRVSDLYQHNEKPLVGLSDTIRTVIMEMTSKRLGATAVVDDQGKITGIITDGDLRRMMEKHDDTREIKASMIMSSDPKNISPDEPAAAALEIMRSNSITQLLVMQNDQYLGVIHIHDILREGIV